MDREGSVGAIFWTRFMVDFIIARLVLGQVQGEVG